MTQFWSNLNLHSAILSPFASSFVKLMSLLKSSKSALDPSHFLRHLKQIILKSGRPDFDIFQQQDAAEILLCVLEELCGESILAQDSINVQVRKSITCTTCQQESVSEESHRLLQLAVSMSIQTSIDLFLNSEVLTNDNMYFCKFCDSLQPAILEHKFCQLGHYLIIQLKRFSNGLIKDIQHVISSPVLFVPVSVDSEIKLKRKFVLKGVINHTGTMNRGHYTAYINLLSSGWHHCNDSAVIPWKKDFTSSSSSYILFYEAS